MSDEVRRRSAVNHSKKWSNSNKTSGYSKNDSDVRIIYPSKQ